MRFYATKTQVLLLFIRLFINSYLNSNKELEIQKSIYTHSGGGSGGYLEHVLIHAAKELFNYELKPNDIVYKQLRNVDFKEVNLEIDGQVKLRFALAYGFRNIQNVVQKMKKNNCSYHYIEIMACPSGKFFILPNFLFHTILKSYFIWLIT
jgi:iron only hydrogenase large subunit-like protein